MDVDNVKRGVCGMQIISQGCFVDRGRWIVTCPTPLILRIYVTGEYSSDVISDFEVTFFYNWDGNRVRLTQTEQYAAVYHISDLLDDLRRLTLDEFLRWMLSLNDVKTFFRTEVEDMHIDD